MWKYVTKVDRCVNCMYFRTQVHLLSYCYHRYYIMGHNAHNSLVGKDKVACKLYCEVSQVTDR